MKALKSFKNRKLSLLPILAAIVVAAGCGEQTASEPEGTDETVKENLSDWTVTDGYIRASEIIGNSDNTDTDDNKDTDDNADASDNTDIGDSAAKTLLNSEYTLSVPTYVDKIGDDWFIADCYHDQIIYNDNLTDPVNEWKVLTKDVSQPHTLAGDGEVMLVDDTENHRVLVFEGNNGGYTNTQVFNEIGQRPHFTVYDEDEKAFYVWSSTTGEMYIFKHEESSNRMYLVEIRRVDGTASKSEGTESGSKTEANQSESGTEVEESESGIEAELPEPVEADPGQAAEAGTSAGGLAKNDSILNGTYIRSFYVEGDDIYFVSGIGAEGKSSGIICCDKYTLKVKTRYNVPDELAGMAALRYDAPYYYITVSTDVAGNQDAATMIRCKDLSDLENGDYEDIYSTYFVGGGTPYNMSEVEGIHYLTEHRLPAHAIWSYEFDEDGNIINVTALY